MSVAPVRVPPPIWLLLLLVAAWLSSRFIPASAVPVVRSMPIGAALVVVSVVLAAWAVSRFAVAGTTIVPHEMRHETLVVAGPYRWTRNPMYGALTIFSLGIAFFSGLLPFFVVPVVMFVLSNVVFIPFEERSLLAQFGDEYRGYVQRVRRWI
jgi:protein-S-isoprenylcysteine O-methyltransferase Ste14